MDYREYYADPDHALLENQYYEAHQNVPQRIHSTDPYNYSSEFWVTYHPGRAALRLGQIAAHNNQDRPWLEMRYIPMGEGYFYPFVDVSLIKPTQLELGETALIDAVRLGTGDVYVVNSTKYPELRGSADEVNVALHVHQDIPALFKDEAADRVFIEIHDRGHSVPSALYKRPSRTDGMYGLPPIFSEPTEETATPYVVLDRKLREFIDTYKQGYPMLNINDFRYCMIVCDELKKICEDKAKLERYLNIRLHPDRVPHLQPQVAHALYLLGKEALGL